MEIATGQKQAFNSRMNRLLADMQASYDSGKMEEDLSLFQSTLDHLASKYQDDSDLGRTRYKLYEAQAYLHFFRHNDDKALDFIHEAIQVRGESFKDAVTLENSISSRRTHYDSATEQEVADLPLNGWLGLIVFSLSVGVIYNIYLIFSGIGNFQDLTLSINTAYPGLHSLLLAEEIEYFVAAMFGIITVVLILQRKYIARIFGIMFLFGFALWVIIDSAIAQSMFANNTQALNAINSSTTNDGRTVVIGVLFALYLIFSKQVKNILVND